MKRVRLTRRAALTGLGASAAATLVRPWMAGAQSAIGPQRLLLIHRPEGVPPGQWFPTGGTDDWQLTPTLQPFEQLHDDMVFLKGVDCPRIQEWSGSKVAAGILAMMGPPPRDPGPVDRYVWPFLPGTTDAVKQDTNNRAITAPDETIDQHFLRNITALRSARVPSLQLGASMDSADQAYDSCTRVVSYAKSSGELPSTPLWPEVRPAAVLQKLFGSFLSLTSQQMAASQALDKSLLDFISGDLARLRPRLPASELPKIDAHLDALRQLEATLGSNGTVARACSPPVLNPLPTTSVPNRQDEAQYTTVCAEQAQLIKTAFQCDLTRVISYTYATAHSNLHFTDILPPRAIVDTGGYDDIADNGGTGYAQAQQAIENFYAEQTARLLLDLKSTPDPAGTGSLLDNTLVVYWNNVSNGFVKSTDDMPIALFGGKFLSLQGGKYLQFGKSARTMADVWVAIAQAWGLHSMTSYGDAMWQRGPMTGLFG